MQLHHEKKSLPNSVIVKPCFPYPGGKTRLLKHILPLIPDHKVYIEPFAGGLATLLSKPRSSVEVVNDLNSELITFYRYVKFHKQALFHELKGYLHSRSNFQDLLATKGLTDLQKAARWYLLKVCSFAGYSDSFGRSKSSYHGWNEKRHCELISAVNERLQRVFIECQDWEKVVSFYDGPDTFTYFDPPYVEADAGAAYDAFSVPDMIRLRDRCQMLKGSWIISCDDSPSCRDIFQGFEFLQIPIKYATARRAGMKTSVSFEMLVMSPDIAAAQALSKAA